MTGDFVIRDREYPRLFELLKQLAPGFVESEEFGRLERADQALPSIVLGAFRRYLQRLVTDASALAQAAESEVERAFRALEQLASSRDPEVVNSLVVEVFEHLDLPDDLIEEVYSRLGPSARCVYDRWIGAPGK